MQCTGNSVVKGFLKAEGTNFVNADGEKVVLTGYAISGWQNPEGFMVGQHPIGMDNVFPKDDDRNYHRFDRRRSISQTVRELCGSEYLLTFWDRWESAYIGEADIAKMAEMGFNCVRIVLNANALLEEEPGIRFNEGAFTRLSRILDWCEQYRIYAVLDMHATVGGVCGICGDSLFHHYPSLLMDAESRERQIILWEELCRRFHDRWILAGYDLANEPVSTPPAYFAIPLLTDFYHECISRMRRIDHGAHIFFLEGPAFARSNEIFDHDFDPEYHNWALNVHIYDADCSMKDLYPYLLKRHELAIPVWISECGSAAINNAAFFDICAQLGIGWSIWTWKVAENCRDAYRCNVQPLPKEWDRIIAFLKGGPRPSYDDSKKIFDEYIENLLFENCRINEDYPRISQKRPDIDLPGAFYDMFRPDGSRYLGNWMLSNYLNFRPEDHTKLVWAVNKKTPFPDFSFDCGPCERETYSPATDLALELNAGEDAFYSVRRVRKTCQLTVEGTGAGMAELFCNGELLGKIEFPKVPVTCPVLSGHFSILPCEDAVIRILVKCGTVTVTAMHFRTGDRKGDKE